MAVQQPPITGDPQLDSFTREVADTINTLQTGNVVNTQQIITTDIAGGAAGPAGVDGLNRATVTLYQRTRIGEDAGLVKPTPVTGTTVFRYNYQTQILANDIGGGVYTGAAPWDGWYDYIPERDPVLQDDYIWYQTINIAERGNFENFFGNQFSEVFLFSKPGTGALRVLTSYNEVVDVDQITFVATAQRILLGELDVTAQIPNGQVCWLLANNDGYMPQGELSQSQFLNIIQNSVPRAPTAAETEFYNRNFTGDVINHIGHTTTFTDDELFTLTVGGAFNDPSITAGGTFSEQSREIEVRVAIDNVVNI